MKKIFAVLISFLLLLALPFSCYAHSGKTDSKGGHRDRSTGEYHYHHGYPAHSHYDIDGDGKKDCPYDFDDNTNHTSGSSSDGTGTADLSFGAIAIKVIFTIIVSLPLLIPVRWVFAIVFWLILPHLKCKDDETTQDHIWLRLLIVRIIIALIIAIFIVW